MMTNQYGKILFAIPNTGYVRAELLIRLFQATKDLGDNFTLFVPMKVPHDANRNHIVKVFKEHKFDWLIMCDSDVVPPANFLDILKHGKKIIAGSVWAYKNGSICLMALNLNEDNKYVPQNNIKELTEVDAVGAGFIAIHKDVINKIPPPLFEFSYTEDGEIENSEDFNFCKKAKEHGFKVYCDPTIKCIHMKEVAIYDDKN